MAPKRRREADASSAEDNATNKRGTRSSTRIATQPKKDEAISTVPTTKPQPKKANTSKTNAKKSAPATRVKSTQQKKAKSIKPNPSSQTASQPANIQNITIESPAIKKAFQCQKYASSQNKDAGKTLIFTHGAGGTIEAPAVVHFCTGFATTLPVLAFQGSMNLPSRAKAFDVCIEHLAEKKEDVEQKQKQKDYVLGGRSMGARAAVIAVSKISAQSEDANIQLILVSYPLKGPKDDIRDQILLDLSENVKVLFVIGDRDAMCPLDLLEGVREKMKAKNEIVVVYGADHGMHLLARDKEDGEGEKELGEKGGRIAAEWVLRGSLEGGGENV